MPWQYRTRGKYTQAETSGSLEVSQKRGKEDISGQENIGVKAGGEEVCHMFFHSKPLQLD